MNPARRNQFRQERGAPPCKMRRAGDVWARRACAVSPPTPGRRGHCTYVISDKGKPSVTAGRKAMGSRASEAETAQLPEWSRPKEPATGFARKSAWRVRAWCVTPRRAVSLLEMLLVIVIFGFL